MMMGIPVDFESTLFDSRGAAGMQRRELQNGARNERGSMTVAEGEESANRNAIRAALAGMSLEELLYYVLVLCPRNNLTK
jgi:hypothetical protein